MSKIITPNNHPRSIHVIKASMPSEFYQAAHEILPDENNAVQVVVWALDDDMRQDRLESTDVKNVKSDRTSTDPFMVECLAAMKDRAKKAYMHCKVQTNALKMGRHFDNSAGQHTAHGLRGIFDRWKYMYGNSARVIINDVPKENADPNAGTLFWDLDEIKTPGYCTKLRAAGFASAAKFANVSGAKGFSEENAWKMRPHDLAIVLTGGKAGKLKLPLHSQAPKDEGTVRILNRLFIAP